jgi:hypothetical protein
MAPHFCELSHEVVPDWRPQRDSLERVVLERREEVRWRDFERPADAEEIDE